MKRLVFAVFLFIISFLLTACGEIKGSYTQLNNSFLSSRVDSDTSSDTQSSVGDGVSSGNQTAVNIAALSDDYLVRITDYIPDAVISIKYATGDNFTKHKIYDFDDAYLRYGTVKKLIKVADVLREKGYYIKIWDAYRPQEAQFELFEHTPDPSYVSDPNKGFSSHSVGGTVDITLVTAYGQEVEMPSGYDDFSAKADRSYSDVSEAAAKNSSLLEDAMESNGFKGYSKEWWHYSDTNTYKLDDIKNIKLPSKSKNKYVVDCNEFINLRAVPKKDSDIICTVPAGIELIPVCWIDKYVGVEYQGKFGFVLLEYLK